MHSHEIESSGENKTLRIFTNVLSSQTFLPPRKAGEIKEPRDEICSEERIASKGM